MAAGPVDASSPRNLEIRGEKAQKRKYHVAAENIRTSNFDHVCPQISYTSGTLQYG